MDGKFHRAGRANKSAYGGGASRPGNSNSGKEGFNRKPNGNKCSTQRAKRQRILRDDKSKSKSPRVPHRERETADNCRRVLDALLLDIRDTFPGYGNADFFRDTSTVARRLAAEGTQFATRCLPDFFDGLLGYLETGKSVYPGFKICHGRQHPHFLKGLVAPIYADPCSDTAIQCMKHLYQFCASFKKLEGVANKKVIRDQLADFVQTDIDLSNLDWSTEPVRDIARQARKIIGRVLRGLDPFDLQQAAEFIPRPGPGSTNTPTKHAHRFRPVVGYSKLTDVFNPQEWFRPPFAPPRSGRCDWASQCPGVTVVGRRKQKERKYIVPDHNPRARFKFVPKTSLKWRGICIEENEVQWHQQAIRRALYKRIESHPETRGRVNFTSQLVNRQLALKGSVFKEWSTIDMSAASDRISRKLVAYLFGENKQLLTAVEACSSDEVELPNDAGLSFIDVMPLKKIAPMGSAICFPVMALVHYSLIRAILDSSSIPHALTRDVYVYGDDIIVRRACAQAIYDYLPLFGMKINTDKSFSHSYFRESCGLHAYKGVDITPTRFKTLLATSPSPASIATALRLEEAFHYKGYGRVAEVIRETVLEVSKKYGINHVPIVNTKSQLFGFYRNDGDAKLREFVKHSKRRWIPGFDRVDRDRVKLANLNVDDALKQRFPQRCPKYSHTWEYRGVVVIVDKFDDDSSFPDDEDRYLRYLTQGGIWASKTYGEGYSRNTMFVRKKLPESSLGYRS